jgi:Domain of unknown function (DUF4915)
VRSGRPQECGVGVIELSTGNTIATLQFATGVEEVFDVQTIPGARCPTFSGSPGDGDEVWLLQPSENRPMCDGDTARMFSRRGSPDSIRTSLVTEMRPRCEVAPPLPSAA